MGAHGRTSGAFSFKDVARLQLSQASDQLPVVRVSLREAHIQRRELEGKHLVKRTRLS